MKWTEATTLLKNKSELTSNVIDEEVVFCKLCIRVLVTFISKIRPKSTVFRLNCKQVLELRTELAK